MPDSMQTNTILRWGIIGGILLVFFIPFVVAYPFFFPFITGKNFAFRIIVEIIFALFALLALRDPSVRPRGNALLYAIGLFLFSIGISAILGENFHKSFWSNFERMEGWIGLAHLAAYFVVLVSMFRSEKMWRLLFDISIGVSVMLAIYGLFQLAGLFTINQGGVRVDATFGNATYLAVYMLFHSFLSVFMIMKYKPSWWLTSWYGLALFLEITMIFFSATRGTILGLVGGALIVGLIYAIFGKEYPRLRTFGAITFAVVVLCIGGFFAIRNTSFVQNNDVLTRIAHISLSEGATRFTIWHMALQGVAERPLFGWGQENFNYIFNKYYDPSLHSQEPWFDRAHDEFLDWLVAGGIVGFLLYLSFFAVALWYLWRKQSSFSVSERGIMTGLLAAYAFHNLFVFDNVMSYILFFTVLAYISFRATPESMTERQGLPAPVSFWSQPLDSSVFPIAAPVIVAVMAGVLYFANVPGMAAAYNLIEAIKPHPEGLTANLASMKAAGSATGLGRQEVREQLVQFALQLKSANIGDSAFQQNVATYAYQQMADEVQKNPNDARLRVFLGSFLRDEGQFDLALPQLLKAHELSVKKQQIIFELAILESNRGNTLGALQWFKQAYELDTAYEQARVYYAATLIRLGSRTLSDPLLMEHFHTTTPDDDIILQAYLDVKDYASVIAIAKGRVEKSPKNTKVRIQLAAAYLQAGQREHAILELQNAIANDSTFASQGQSFIQQIQQGKNP